MIRFMLEKLKHKKWMVLCLLIGNVLLIAVTASQSIYKSASFQRMLTEEFDKKKAETGVWPQWLRFSLTTGEYAEISGLEGYAQESANQFQVPVMENVVHVKIREQILRSTMQREDGDNITASVGFMSDFENHINLIAGKMYGTTLTEDGCIEVVVNQEALIQMNVLLDETLGFKKLVYDGDKTVFVKIVGVYEPKDTEDPYWLDAQKDFSKECFTSAEVFDYIFADQQDCAYVINYDTLFDYEQMDPAQISTFSRQTNTILNHATYGKYMRTPAYMSVFQTFQAKQKKITATLFILQIPCLILLCAFLFMISEQMLRMEQNEISMLKSRGAKKSQILLLYLMQSTLLAFIGLLIGLPLGKLLCSLLGSARAFLEFDLSRLLKTSFTWESLLYGLAAMAVSVTMTVIPVIKYSDVSIVNLKQSKARTKKPAWMRFGLDFILIGISLYGYYSFSKTSESIKEQVITGKSLDPFLYFCATFFILGIGLLFLRVHPLMIKLLYKLREKKLSSAGYMSFLSTIRTISKQQFIMLFMILTVALGIFYVTIARTILDNAERNIEYLDGCDVILEEKWKDNSAWVKSNDKTKIEYYEPEFGAYYKIDGVGELTKVLYDDVRVKDGADAVKLDGKIMGIRTKEFGEMTQMSDELFSQPYYDYLNALANTPNGVLLSENMRTQFQYKIGDLINVTVRDRMFSLKVIGFVDYWPTYRQTEYITNESGNISTRNNYLMVSNLSYIQQKIDITPYHVWMKFNGTTEDFYRFVKENDIKVKSYQDAVVEKDELQTDTLFQGTNGILSLSFIVILLLCGVGYLIYWIMSIRSRELLFGILRAMGMSKKEILHILLNEQIFCGVMSIAAGVLIGTATSKMFVPMIQNAYAATDQVLPLHLVYSISDLSKLFITIAMVLIACIIVLVRIIGKTNITSALKLGED